MKKIEIFRTLFPHLVKIFPASCGLKRFIHEIKKCRNAYLSSISAKYPERDLNPHSRNGHRILSPDNFPETIVKSELSMLHFDAKCNISALFFRTSSVLHFLKIVLEKGLNISFLVKCIKKV